MSRWTYIRGAVEMAASPFESKDDGKGGKDYYIPHPEDQLKVYPGRIATRIGDDGNPSTKLEMEVRLTSFPRVEEYLKAAFSKLPQGETGFGYFLDTDRGIRSSRSYFYTESEEKDFRGAVERYFSQNADSMPSYMRHYLDFESIDNRFHIDLGMIDEAGEFAIGIRNDLRYCSGMELMRALEDAFAELESHGVYAIDGYLEWKDGYVPDYIYAWRFAQFELASEEEYSFMVLDAKTNAIVWKRKYRRPKGADGMVDWDAPLIHEDEGDLPEEV